MTPNEIKLYSLGVKIVDFKEIKTGRNFRARNRFFSKFSETKAHPIDFSKGYVFYEPLVEFELDEQVAKPTMKYNYT